MIEKSTINEEAVLGCKTYGQRRYDPDYYIARNRIRECALELHKSGINLRHIREWLVYYAGSAGEETMSLVDIESIDTEIEFLRYLEVKLAGRLRYTKALRQEVSDMMTSGEL